MQVLYPRCAGLDVHKDTVVAAVRCVSSPVHHEVQSFATTTGGRLALNDWPAAPGTAGSDPPAQAVGAGDLPALVANPEGARGCQPQAGQRPVRPPGPERS